MDLRIGSSGIEERIKREEENIKQGMREFYEAGIGDKYTENHEIQMDIKMYISLTQLHLKMRKQNPN
ncbi:MAG: hypothetical protein NTZ83_03325 [Candidatus Pacearchaeota archaeon]|nr:hypothetical protein [Candidatus Pacearchaeota archaeon]